MTTIVVHPDRLRAFADHARADLEAVAARLAAVDRLVREVGRDDGFPANASLVDDVASVVAALFRLVAIPDLVADEAERLDRRLRDRPLVPVVLRLGATTPPPADDLARVLQALDGPRQVHGLWRTLTAGQVDVLVRTHPELVGGLDGVPLAARDRANRRQLAAHRSALARRIAHLETQGGRTRRLDDAVAHTGRHLDLAHAAVLRRRLDRLDTIRDADMVLLWEPSGDGRAVVAWGDPGRAATVTTFVPGMANSLATFHRVAVDAHVLHRAIQGQRRPASPHQDTGTGATTDIATVAWLGYDAPSGPGWGIVAAATDHVAAAERDRLVAWGAGLRVLNPAARHVVVAHSYGSVLAGQALRAHDGGSRLDVDRLVVLGSPGLGSGLDDVAGLGLSRGQVHAAAAPRDPVPHLPVLGPDPAGWPDVVAVPLGPGNDHHSDYLAPGSRGLVQTARIVLGLRPLRADAW